MKKIKVLMVCMGNICRSPTAHGVFEALVRDEGLDHLIEVDSAGTHAYHIGEPPDPRSQQTARNRGLDISSQRARKAIQDDFHQFDYVLAMDQDNFLNLKSICPPGKEDRLHLFMDFSDQFSTREVPDPYYGGANGFESVFDMVDSAAKGLLNHIKGQHFS